MGRGRLPVCATPVSLLVQMQATSLRQSSPKPRALPHQMHPTQISNSHRQGWPPWAWLPCSQRWISPTGPATGQGSRRLPRGQKLLQPPRLPVPLVLAPLASPVRQSLSVVRPGFQGHCHRMAVAQHLPWRKQCTLGRSSCCTVLALRCLMLAQCCMPVQQVPVEISPA